MIAKAAVKIKDLKQNKEIIIPCHRHCDAYEILYNFGYKREDYITLSQGFLDNHNIFMNRHNAWREAKMCKQLLVVDENYQELYSEDLW